MVTTASLAANERSNDERQMDEAVAVLRDNAEGFAALGAKKKAALLRACMQRLAEVAGAWVDAGTQVRRTPEHSGEEWFQGPVCLQRQLGLLVRTLESIDETGGVGLHSKQFQPDREGRLRVETFPTDRFDGALLAGFSATQLMQPGCSEEDVRSRAGEVYRLKRARGGVSLVLGAGNAGAIGPGDALYKLINRGQVVLLKMNPVNAEGAPFLERAFAPLIEAGYLRIVRGGAEVGAYLVDHPEIDDVHITGSNATHDRIVWGPAGEQRERRRRSNDPLLKKPITSELGNVSPVAVVPARYSNKELDFIAKNIVAMVAQNASFNCNAARVLVLSRAWSQRDALMARIAAFLEQTPTRYAYYPGARERYERALARLEYESHGAPRDGHLPWAIVRGQAPDVAGHPLYTEEIFCPILCETVLDAADPVEFLSAFTRFANERLWGTLNATIVLPKGLETSSEVGGALERAIIELRYGTVGINQWPALGYAMGSPAWGGHPSSTLADVQSGLGWVHNTYLLEGIEKTVIRGPLSVWPKPAWFVDNASGFELGRRFMEFYREPSWAQAAGLALAAMRG
jgi:acyl-CoA reductase-like NAD-dependent aldehyde dehydrogenase